MYLKTNIKKYASQDIQRNKHNTKKVTLKIKTKHLKTTNDQVLPIFTQFSSKFYIN